MKSMGLQTHSVLQHCFSNDNNNFLICIPNQRNYDKNLQVHMK